MEHRLTGATTPTATSKRDVKECRTEKTTAMFQHDVTDTSVRGARSASRQAAWVVGWHARQATVHRSVCPASADDVRWQGDFHSTTTKRRRHGSERRRLIPRKEGNARRTNGARADCGATATGATLARSPGERRAR